MAKTYKTPGVYIEEVSLLPPSIAAVETAIPAFIGYTQKAKKNNENLTNVPTRISARCWNIKLTLVVPIRKRP